MLDAKLSNSWKTKLESEFDESYMLDLKIFLKNEQQAGKIIYPDSKECFTGLNQTPFEKVKVVIIGQDPYHGPGQAHGLSFSVKPGVKFPPSLKNIFKELHSDLGFDFPESGSLLKWADQGVLLINSVLTVEGGKPASHQDRGWEKFTNKIVELLNDERQDIAFVLWGKYAQKKAAFVDRKKHFVLESAHPSPFSAYNGFFGSKPFSQINNFLQKTGQEKINWNLQS